MNRRERRSQQRQKDFGRIEKGKKANFHRCTNEVSADNLMQTFGGIQKGNDGEWRLVKTDEVVKVCPFCPERLVPKEKNEIFEALNEAFIRGDKD